MKKLLVLMLITALSVFCLVGCGNGDNNATPPANQQQNEPTQTSKIDDSYPFVEATTATRTVKVYYDNEVLFDGGSYDNFIGFVKDTEDEFGTYQFYIYDYDSIDSYITSRLDGINATHQDAVASKLGVTQLAGYTVNSIQFDYNVKSYISDEKIDMMTDEEIEQLEFELIPKTSISNVIELDSGLILVFSGNILEETYHEEMSGIFELINFVVQ